MKAESFGVDLIELLIERRIINPASPEQSQDPVPLASFLLQSIREVVQLLLPALALAVLHRNALSQPLQNLARVPQERFDVRPDQPLHIVAIQTLGRALLAGESVQPAGLLAPVAAVIVVSLVL